MFIPLVDFSLSWLLFLEVSFLVLLITNFINKNPFIKACLIISGVAIIFLLGTNVGNTLHTLAT